MKTRTVAAQVAALIRSELKTHGIPGRVNSKNYSGGDSVSVTLFDPLPKTLERVTIETAQYELGHFDGMSDCYTFSNRRKDIPQVYYLFVYAEYSEDLRQECWDYLKSQFNYTDAPTDYKNASSYPVCFGMIEDGSQLIANELRTGSNGFWYSKKPRLS